MLTAERDARGRQRVTHIDQGTGAEASASIEPVVAFELVYFNAFAIVDSGRRQSHYTGMGGSPSDRSEGETRSDRTGMESVVGWTLRREMQGRRRRGIRWWRIGVAVASVEICAPTPKKGTWRGRQGMRHSDEGRQPRTAMPSMLLRARWRWRWRWDVWERVRGVVRCGHVACCEVARSSRMEQGLLWLCRANVLRIVANE